MRKLENDAGIICPYDRSIFTDSVLNHIVTDGFEYSRDTTSYASMEDYGTYDEDVSGSAYKKGYNESFDIFVFIRNKRIEVDVDYECGGNYSNTFWEFDSHESFEEAYDNMVEFVNQY